MSCSAFVSCFFGVPLYQRGSDRLSSRSESPLQVIVGLRRMGVMFDELPSPLVRALSGMNPFS